MNPHLLNDKPTYELEKNRRSINNALNSFAVKLSIFQMASGNQHELEHNIDFGF